MPKLEEIAKITAGHAFRGAVTPDEEGESLVIQMKDVDSEQLVSWDSLESTNPPGRKEPDWLRCSDIIFLARGRQNYAIHLPEPPRAKLLCTQHFFVIRIVDRRFSPAFVSWQLNQTPAQGHFDRNAAGGKSRNITLATLKSTEIVWANDADQAKVETLNRLVQQEQHLFKRLMTNRKQQISALAQLILNPGGVQ